MAHNVTGITETREAGLPSAPPGEAAQNRPPKPAETRRDKREAKRRPL